MVRTKWYLSLFIVCLAILFDLLFLISFSHSETLQLLLEDWESYEIGDQPAYPWLLIGQSADVQNVTIVDFEGSKRIAFNNLVNVYMRYLNDIAITKGMITLSMDYYKYSNEFPSDFTIWLVKHDEYPITYFYISTFAAVAFCDDEIECLEGEEHLYGSWVNVKFVININPPNSESKHSLLLNNSMTGCTDILYKYLNPYYCKFAHDFGFFDINAFITDHTTYVDNISLTCEDCVFSYPDDDDDDNDDNDDNNNNDNDDNDSDDSASGDDDDDDEGCCGC